MALLLGCSKGLMGCAAVLSNALVWRTRLLYIATYGTSLATIRSSDENEDAASTALGAFGSEETFWIGLNDINNENDYQ